MRDWNGLSRSDARSMRSPQGLRLEEPPGLAYRQPLWNLRREIQLILGDAQRHPVLPRGIVGPLGTTVNAEDAIAEDDVERRFVLEVSIPGVDRIERLA